MDFSKDLHIRQLEKEDLEAIVTIDEKVMGQNRRDFWERKLDSMNGKSSIASLVIEIEGKVVGFVLGDVSGWEFGTPQTVAWIDTVGIDPAYRKRGLATALTRELVKNLRSFGVTTIYTLVKWSDWDLLQFYHSMGFSRGDMINLELKIS